MVVVVLGPGIVRHRIMVEEIVRRGTGTAERGRLGMETVELVLRVMAMVEGHVLPAMAEALVLLGMEGELLRVGLDRLGMVEGHVLLGMEGELRRVMVVERDRQGTEEAAGHRLLLGQQHLRLALHLRPVLHLRRGLRLGPRREVLSQGIRREERSRRNGLSRRVRGRADLAAITMAQRHGRPATEARPVLAVVEHVREANLDEALQT
jgi:hypothetical protein